MERERLGFDLATVTVSHLASDPAACVAYRTVVPRAETCWPAYHPASPATPSQTGGKAMALRLRCDICGREGGEYDSRVEWEDAARRRGWAIGEHEVICRQCLTRAEPPNGGPPA